MAAGAAVTLDLTADGGSWEPQAGTEIDLTRTLSSEEAVGRTAEAAAAPGDSSAVGGSGATIDLSGPNLMAEARHLSSIFPDLRPANILAVLMDFQDYHDDPVSLSLSLSLFCACIEL